MSNIIQKENELVRYLFDKIPTEEARRIEYMISEDLHLEQQFEQLLEIKARLEHAAVTPSDEVIRHILNYSKAFTSINMS